MKYTDSKEFNKANFISRNPTEIAEPEQNYEKEYVINAIAQLTTEYGRIGRLFNQSESAEIDKMADLHDTLAQPDTCNCKKNNYHSHSNSTANQINIENTRRTFSQAKLNNDNNDNRQTPGRLLETLH